jgi:hypothetical protein
MKKAILALLAAMATVSVSAFEVDGFRTGMNVSETAAVVQRQGWTLGPSNLAPGIYVEAHYNQDGKVSELGPANFTFCDGRLIAYLRSLDFDTEYAPKVRDMIVTYGSQPRVEVDQSAWNGPGGGYIMSVRTMWNVGRERAEISFEPEGHTGNGALKHYRGATVSYVLPGACSKE